MCFDGCFALCERLRRNDASLTVLNLNNLYMGNDGAKALAQALATNTAVVVVFLQHNSLGPSGIRALTAALAHHPRLAHLYLDDNAIGNEGCAALADFIKTSRTLRVLKLADNGITAAGAQVLAQALSHEATTSLEYLSLHKNQLGEEGMRTLTQALAMPTAKSLRWLDVRCNKVQHYASVLQDWIRVLRHDNETLCVLELWESNELPHVLSASHGAGGQTQTLLRDLQFWLQWNRVGRRSLKCTTDTLPVTRLLANAAKGPSASPAVLWATLQARPDLVAK